MSFGSLLSTVLLYYDFSRPERKETRLIMMFKVPLCIPYFLAALQFDGFPFFFGQEVESSSISDVLLCG